jgi:hypothetical protein
VDGQSIEVTRGSTVSKKRHTRTEESLINHVKTVGHADDEDVVELVDTIHLGEELVDNRVPDTGPVVLGTTLLTNRIKLIKDDDVKVTLIPLFLVLW